MTVPDDNEAMPPTAKRAPYCCPKHLAEGWHCPAPCGQQCCLDEAATNEAMRERLEGALLAKGFTHRSRYEVARWVIELGWRDDGDERVERARDLHHKVQWSGWRLRWMQVARDNRAYVATAWCVECHQTWPCQTRAALDGGPR